MTIMRIAMFLWVIFVEVVYSFDDNCIRHMEFTQLQQEVIAIKQELIEMGEQKMAQDHEVTVLRNFKEKQNKELTELRNLTNALSETVIAQEQEIQRLGEKVEAQDLREKNNLNQGNSILHHLGPNQGTSKTDLQCNHTTRKNHAHSKRYLLGQENGGVAFSVSVTQWDVTNLGQGQTIIFDRVISNLGNAYDKNVGLFKVPVQGWYVFSLTLMGVPGETQQELEVIRNGSVLFHCLVDGDEFNTASRTIVVHANVGDDVSVQTAKWQHSDRLHGNDHTSFSGFLLYADTMG